MRGWDVRAIWKGAISFGLVNIPITLFPATRREELKFRLLRASDLSPVNYKRVAEVDGKEVPWEEIVKGYEYEKGKFVVLKEEDFQRVDIEATQTVEITDFVELAQVDPMFFSKPYYMEPDKGGERAYVLLRQALEASGKIGIAKVVIRTRQHLAAVKPEAQGLILETMHFSEELVDPASFRIPSGVDLGKKEMQMAQTLVQSMSTSWEPEKYKDDYRQALEKVIEEKVQHGGRVVGRPKSARPATKVIDLVQVLQESLAQAQKGEGKRKRKAG